MKKKAITGILIMFIFTVIAGASNLLTENAEEPGNNSLELHEDMPSSYLGLTTGLNFGGLFAIAGDFHLNQNTTFAPSLGIGSWGFKLGLDFRFYRNHPVGRFFSVGVSRATGLPEPLELEMATTNNSSGENVSITYNPVNNLNLGMGYAWKMGNRSRFVLDFGYALKVSRGDGYEVGSGKTLTDESKQLMAILRPGGLRLGLGFHFGL